MRQYSTPPLIIIAGLSNCNIIVIFLVGIIIIVNIILTCLNLSNQILINLPILLDILAQQQKNTDCIEQRQQKQQHEVILPVLNNVEQQS